ncbi:phosphofructokinase [Salinibacterium sp. dk2585]|uniref:1-phosphofructokinase family hexose kinase n=1 Tax=unclassified Salinibacterium TaxID=2632331 RepID=UPI0011C25287|nr:MULTISPECIES: PfkB family carbohydrate kinase [unclassified Salinibacterium]QEE61863.1 phosphofructokinase [Salinibacterium sp. dk2585]TXK54582.1 phosphofructokinase [Salinibacterium sp. dk5596]
MSRVVIFAPSPLLTVTVENHGAGDELHLHAGGQGVWQGRMLRRMGVDVTMCCALIGESGTVLGPLLSDEGFTVEAVEVDGNGGGYVHDRRGGERESVVEIDGSPLDRHTLDELYTLTLREALGADAVILSGPAGDETLPAEVYRRLAADLGAAGCTVIVDLAGERLSAALEGGVEVVKVSDEELVADGRASKADDDSIMAGMRAMAQGGARSVIVSRSPEPILVLQDGTFHEVHMPEFEAADTRGAGDSLTAGVTAAIARGESLLDAVRLGAAAGALNVTRHGLGTGDAEAIEKLRTLAEVRATQEPTTDTATTTTPGDLAARAKEE